MSISLLPVRPSFIVLLFLVLPVFGTAQINLVPNPGFEDISDCDLEYGDADKALPWQIINDPIASPDLYHACSTNGFYDLPVTGCEEGTFPKSGVGMVGMVNLTAEERISVRLLDTLPKDIDIYVAFSTIPRQICDLTQGILCYSNTQCLAFSDFAYQSETLVLQPPGIIDDAENWTTLETCYRASGREDLVLLGNFRLASETLRYCPETDPQNFSYHYVDDVIVAPFDVVPDTLYLCEGEVLNLDVTFYEVPISWSDGVTGAIRTIERGGDYIVRGNLAFCSLTDRTLVIEIPIGTEELELDICKGETVTLSSPFAGTWENGDTNRTRIITQAGNYKSTLLTPCGERSREYTITTTDCEINYFVPNAFSPNNDGINDRLQFFFAADFDFTGELNIFDRWGNQLFNAQEVSPLSPVTWDGKFKNKDLGAGIVVWTYSYVSARDGQTRTISGDVMVVR